MFRRTVIALLSVTPLFLAGAVPWVAAAATSTTSASSPRLHGSASASTAPVPKSHVAPPLAGTGTWWHPSAAPMRWQWELDHVFDPTNPTDLGLNDTLPNGAAAAAPTVYDIDAIENTAATVAAIHQRGAKAICYIEVGTAGDYYTVAQEGTTTTTYFQRFQAAGVLGAALSGYPENFLNIAAPATTTILEQMIKRQCAMKGFDAVETDLDETYSGSDGPTGFSLTRAEEMTFLTGLATYMHSLGMAWIIKNPDDTGDNFAQKMEPIADAVLTEQCNEYSTCSQLQWYVGKKAVFNAEYNLDTSSFCGADAAMGFNGVAFNQNLDGTQSPCR